MARICGKASWPAKATDSTTSVSMNWDPNVEPVARSQSQRPRVRRRNQWNSVMSASWPSR